MNRFWGRCVAHRGWKIYEILAIFPCAAAVTASIVRGGCSRSWYGTRYVVGVSIVLAAFVCSGRRVL